MIRAYLIDVARSIRFFSRLPLPALPGEQDIHALHNIGSLARGLPLGGALIGLLPALAMGAAMSLGLSAMTAAAFALCAALVTTSALHEDGLADTADGLGGGGSPERRLAIMKDSRIGAYGACALGISLIIRVSLLADIAARGDWLFAAAAIIAAASLSRIIGLAPLAYLPAARPDGLSASVGALARGDFWRALLVSVGLAAVLVTLAGGGMIGLALGIMLAGAAAAWLIRLARRLIGGQTGDIAGAAQQLAEIGLLTGLAIGIGWQ